MLERLRSGPFKWIALPLIVIGVLFVAIRRFAGGGDSEAEEA